MLGEGHLVDLQAVRPLGIREFVFPHGVGRDKTISFRNISALGLRKNVRDRIVILFSNSLRLRRGRSIGKNVY